MSSMCSIYRCGARPPTDPNSATNESATHSNGNEGGPNQIAQPGTAISVPENVSATNRYVVRCWCSIRVPTDRCEVFPTAAMSATRIRSSNQGGRSIFQAGVEESTPRVCRAPTMSATQRWRQCWRLSLRRHRPRLRPRPRKLTPRSGIRDVAS